MILRNQVESRTPKFTGNPDTFSLYFSSFRKKEEECAHSRSEHYGLTVVQMHARVRIGHPLRTLSSLLSSMTENAYGE